MNVRVVVWIASLNLAQLPIAMRPLLITLLADQRTGSFTLAGVAAGVTAAGMAVSAPWWSRALGRYGDARVLVLSGALFVLAQVALVCTPGMVALVVTSAVAGLCTPPVAPSVRARLPAALATEELSRGYTANAVGQEVVYIGGPLWVAGWVSLAGPAGALLASAMGGAVATVASLLIFQPRPDQQTATGARPDPLAPATRPRPNQQATTIGPQPDQQAAAIGTRSDRGAAARPRGARRSPLRLPASVTLGGSYLAYWVCMGAMWVLLPAFATHLGQSGQTGVLVAIWSAGSLVGGLLVVTVKVPVPLHTRYLALLAMLTATSVFLLLPDTTWTMAVAVGVFGLPLAPWLAVADELVMVSVGPMRSAEMYGWLTTLGQVGGAIGSALAGPLAQRYHGGLAFVIVTVALGIGVAFALARWRTLQVDRDVHCGVWLPGSHPAKSL